MSSAAPLPSTPGGQTQGDGGNGNIKDSIAALRSILMIDTPTKSLLSSTDNPSIAAQQSRYDARKQQWEEIASLRNTTSVLKHRVQEVTNEASLETRKRKTLQTAYDALAKHKKELSVQLELVTKSREASEEKLANMRKALGEERGAMAQERVAWRPEMDRLSRDKTKFENKCQELEARSVAADRKVQELQQKVNRLEKGLSDTKAQLEENQTVQTALLPRAEQSEKARRKAEESLAQVQTELNTIKGRHHKSLTSMLDMQQKSKQELKEAQEGKQIAEERHQQALQNLKEAKTAEKNAIDAMQKATAEAQDLNFLNTIETKQKIQLLTKQLEESEEARTRIGEELEHLRKQPQPSIQLPTNQNADEQVEGISNSIVALDQLIHDATEMGEDQLGFDFVHQLAQVAKHVKADMSGMQSAKEKAEAKCNATSAADEDMEYELASSRESLREARDQLLDSREEAEQLQTEVASLRLELEKRSGRKRAYDDRSESEEDEDEGGDDDDDDDDEEDFHSPNSKRHREDFFDDSVPV